MRPRARVRRTTPEDSASGLEFAFAVFAVTLLASPLLILRIPELGTKPIVVVERAGEPVPIERRVALDLGFVRYGWMCW